jgi:hypothetical protein
MATNSSAIQKKIETLKKGLNNKFITASQKEKIKAQVEKLESQAKASAPKKASKPAATSLTRLQKMVNKKKYGIYKGAGVDLQKDSDRPAKAIGKRTSKSGKTYYEYRANRIDVKQPPKRYPKLEKGGYMAKGGETAKFQVDDVVYHKGHNTIGIVRIEESRGELKTDADGNVNVDELEYYNPLKHESHKNAKIAPSTLKEIEKRRLWNPFSERTSKLADGGRVKGRNNETGETYGVVIGSVKKSDENIEDGTEMNVRKSYSSRISEVKLVFDNNGNLYEITDYGYALEGNYPDTSRGSGRNYNADKKETLEILSKKYNPAFAKKLIELAKNPKMAEGGMTEHGLRIGDKITTDMFWDNQIVVENTKTNKRAQIDLETGKRKDEMEKGGYMADGGVTEKEVVDSNAEMVLSQIKAVKHHAEELSSVVSRKSNIEAWVVGKIERASTDLSDITHYLEGNKDKMSMGGTVRHYAHKMDKK